MPDTSNHSESVDQLHISPDSRHAQLLALAADAGRDVGVIAEMLRFLDVHSQLIDFPRVKAFDRLFPNTPEGQLRCIPAPTVRTKCTNTSGETKPGEVREQMDALRSSSDELTAVNS